MTVHYDQKASPFELCTCSLPDLHLLYIFGCHVYLLPACPHHPNKPVPDTCIGIFLGFLKTMKNIIYFDTHSKTAKLSQHITFYEAMHNADKKSLNACLLTGLTAPGSPDILDLTLSILNLDGSAQPITDLETFVVTLDASLPSPLGMHFDTCSHLKCTYVCSIIHPPPSECLPASTCWVLLHCVTWCFVCVFFDQP